MNTGLGSLEISNLTSSSDIVVTDIVDQSVASLMGELGKHMEGQLQAAVTTNGTDGDTSLPLTDTSSQEKSKGKCISVYYQFKKMFFSFQRKKL